MDPKQKATINIIVIPWDVTQGRIKSWLLLECTGFPGVASSGPLPVSSQALSQSHPSGIQPHTQLQLPEWLSRPAASLLTEVRYSRPRGGAPWTEGGHWEGRTLCVNKRCY